MLHPALTDIEVAYRQQTIRAGYIRAQRQISIAGMRQILGNSIIEAGTRIYGVTQGTCAGAAEIRGMIRTTLRSSLPAEARS